MKDISDANPETQVDMCRTVPYLFSDHVLEPIVHTMVLLHVCQHKTTDLRGGGVERFDSAAHISNQSLIILFLAKIA